MAAVVKTQLTMTLTAIGVGIFVVYLLLPFRVFSTPKPKTVADSLQRKRHPLEEAVSAATEVEAGSVSSNRSDRTRYSNNLSTWYPTTNSPNNKRIQNDSVRHIQWASEASSKPHGQRAACK